MIRMVGRTPEGFLAIRFDTAAAIPFESMFFRESRTLRYWFVVYSILSNKSVRVSQIVSRDEGGSHA